MIRDRHLSHSDYLIQHHDIFHQAVCQRVQRHLIGPGVNISGNTLIFKCVGIGKQGRHIPAYTVSANASHYRSHTVSDQIAQSCFRCSRMKSAFAASAHDMLMTVDKSGDSSHSVGINHFDLYAAAEISGQVFSYCRDLSPRIRISIIPRYSGSYTFAFFIILTIDMFHPFSTEG